MKTTKTKHLQKLVLAPLTLGLLSACTGQIPNSFRLAQQQETFASQLDINTKIDLLFVVDNSSSMDSVQDKLRKGFAGFAQKYMQPTWDIRVAVITTDAYLANTAYQPFINSVAFSSTGFTTSYVSTNKAIFQNPPASTTCSKLVDNGASGTGNFLCDLRYKDLIPSWGPDYAKLQAGNHDGPVTGFCFESMPYFFKGPTDCATRDYSGATDASKCLNKLGTEDPLKQCVNTVQNNTVRSGKPILQTMPPSPLSGAALDQWKQDLIDNFTINVTTGSVGMGSERGLQSLLQMLSDNETGPVANRLFRQGSLRGLIFVSDGDDQTMDVPASPPTGFNPWTGYYCDKTTLDAMNVGNSAYTNFCCTGASCAYQPAPSGCGAKSINGVPVMRNGQPYVISLCATGLTPVSTIKSRIDTFFQTLDNSGSTGAPGYFVASIVPLDATTINTMQDDRDIADAVAGQPKTNSIEVGQRYIDLGNAVGNGSLALDINASDYSTLLDSIGNAIIQQKSQFTLARAPTAQEDMLVIWNHASGGTTLIDSSKYTISGKVITITDTTLVLSFVAGDSISINYQPRSQN